EEVEQVLVTRERLLLLHLARELVDDRSATASEADEEGRRDLGFPHRHRCPFLDPGDRPRGRPDAGYTRRRRYSDSCRTTRIPGPRTWPSSRVWRMPARPSFRRVLMATLARFAAASGWMSSPGQPASTIRASGKARPGAAFRVVASSRRMRRMAPRRSMSTLA